jgi:heme/copper-type cytochrome/quinol oxidase subunit 3
VVAHGPAGAATRSAAAHHTPAPSFFAERHVLAMCVFIASESIFFLSVVAIYLAYRQSTLETARASLEVMRTFIFSLLLFSSSATMALAARSPGPRGRLWLIATAVLGAVFLGGQVSEYARLLAGGIRPSTDLFGTTFFTLTGLHGAHVLVGLVAIVALVAASWLRGGAVRRTAWESVSLYWHFVDAVWVVVFTTVYLGTFV